MDKETFVKLAEGYILQEKYEDEFSNTIKELAKEHKQDIDFLGLPIGTNAIMSPVLEILGEDFAYFHSDCGDDFNKFNKGITLADGSHPRIRSLVGLYKFAKEQGSIK